MGASAMEDYFYDVAAVLDRSLAPGEVYTCALDAEVSDPTAKRFFKVMAGAAEATNLE